MEVLSYITLDFIVVPLVNLIGSSYFPTSVLCLAHKPRHQTLNVGDKTIFQRRLLSQPALLGDSRDRRSDSLTWATIYQTRF